jgi:hypothetical protein
MEEALSSFLHLDALLTDAVPDALLALHYWQEFIWERKEYKPRVSQKITS